MALSKIQSSNINLADNFAFTGTVSGAGKILQTVIAYDSSTNNYASVNYQNTSLDVAITPTKSNSKFLIRYSVYGGVANHDVACAFNISDSLHASGVTTHIAPHSVTGGDNNGSSGGRMASFTCIGSWASSGSSDDWFVGHSTGEYLYTPAYQNTTARTFTIMVRTALGANFRLGMNGQQNSADPRDVRFMSVISVTEMSA
tara:strand:+ start:162 stop:764 length:603 start_codon:yes stop_codon:yes gene_type:complete